MIALYFLVSVFVSHALLRLLRFVANQYKAYQMIKKLPGPEFYFPFFGNLFLFMELLRKSKRSELSREFFKMLTKAADSHDNEKYGLLKIWLGPFVPMVVITNARVAQKVFNNQQFLDKASFYGLFRFAVDDGIFTCNTEKWRKQKREIQEHFKFQAFETYIPNTERHLQVFSQRIENCIKENDGKVADVKPLVSTLVLDVLGENLFSTNFNSQKTGQEPRFVQIVQQLLEISYRALLQPWTYFFSNVFLRYFFTLNIIRETLFLVMSFKSSVHKIVINRFKQLQSDCKGTKRLSMLDSMIMSRVSQSRVTRLHEIEAQMNTFVIAGHDTTTSAITWLLYLLAHHPEVQEKLRQEVDQYLDELQQNDERITLSSLKKLKYLDSCIKETLRLYPSGPFIARRGRQPLELSEDVTLPAFSNVILFIQYIHTSDKYFRDPHRFYPERFLTNGNDPENPWLTNSAFMPFSTGLRVCVGKEYGMVQQKLFLIHLLRKFSFTPLDQYYGSVQPKFDFLLSSAHFPIQFRKRQPASQ